jgi:hypothetical protein
LKTFAAAFTILVSHHRYHALKLEDQQKLLKRFINEPAEEYFRRRSKHSKALNELKIAYNAGWKMEALRIKKWNLRFVADNLALLLVLRGQVKKELEEQEANRKATWTGVPKATELKRHLPSCGTPMRRPSRTT